MTNLDKVPMYYVVGYVLKDPDSPYEKYEPEWVHSAPTWGDALKLFLENVHKDGAYADPRNLVLWNIKDSAGKELMEGYGFIHEEV
jgi:hypothetical protein